MDGEAARTFSYIVTGIVGWTVVYAIMALVVSFRLPGYDAVLSGLTVGKRVAGGVATWVGGWLTATAAVFAIVTVVWYAQGGVYHRVPVCGGYGNIYGAAVASGLLGVIVVLVYWALGPVSIRWRMVRLLVVAVDAVPLVLAALICSQLWNACT